MLPLSQLPSHPHMSVHSTVLYKNMHSLTSWETSPEHNTCNTFVFLLSLDFKLVNDFKNYLSRDTQYMFSPALPTACNAVTRMGRKLICFYIRLHIIQVKFTHSVSETCLRTAQNSRLCPFSDYTGSLHIRRTWISLWRHNLYTSWCILSETQLHTTAPSEMDSLMTPRPPPSAPRMFWTSKISASSYTDVEVHGSMDFSEVGLDILLVPPRETQLVCLYTRLLHALQDGIQRTCNICKLTDKLMPSMYYIFSTASSVL